MPVRVVVLRGDRIAVGVQSAVMSEVDEELIDAGNIVVLEGGAGIVRGGPYDRVVGVRRHHRAAAVVEIRERGVEDGGRGRPRGSGDGAVADRVPARGPRQPRRGRAHRERQQHCAREECRPFAQCATRHRISPKPRTTPRRTLPARHFARVQENNRGGGVTRVFNRRDRYDPDWRAVFADEVAGWKARSFAELRTALSDHVSYEREGRGGPYQVEA